MSESAVWQVKRVTWAVPVPTLAALRIAGPPLLLGLLAAIVAIQLQGSSWRSRVSVYMAVPTSRAVSLIPFGADPTPYFETQARIARSPKVAARAVRTAGVAGITVDWFLRHSSATLAADNPFTLARGDRSRLILSVSDRRRPLAIRLTQAYANAFAQYKHDRLLRRMHHGQELIQAELQALRDSGRGRSREARSLVKSRAADRDFFTMLAVSNNNTGADRGSSFRPHTLRNGLLGAALGALLGVALAVGIARRRA